MVEANSSNNKKTTIECPFCHSHDLMQIGNDLYMCEACKGKFLDTNNSNGSSITYTRPVLRQVTPKTVENELEEIESEVKKTKVKVKKNKRSSSDKKKLFKSVIITSCTTVLFVAVITASFLYEKNLYYKALDLVETNTTQAIDLFKKCTWKDSKQQMAFAQARVEFNNDNYNDGIMNMVTNGGCVYVNYDSNGGQSYNPDIFKTKNFTIPISSKEGYEFVDWHVENYKFTENNYRVNLALTASWLIK